MHSLPIFVKLRGRNVILVGDGPAADAKRRLLERAGACVVGESAAAALAIVALEDEVEAIDAVDRLRGRGTLVNATDRPDLCDFTLPAIVDRDPVLIAIGTGGASAGLAKVLRQLLETILPQSLGSLTTTLRESRDKIRARWPDPATRRKAIDDALDPGGPLDPLANHEAGDVDAWLAAPDAEPSAGLHVIVSQNGDPDDLTLRDARALGRADTVVHDPGIPVAILNRARADAARLESADLPDPLPNGLTVHIVRRT